MIQLFNGNSKAKIFTAFDAENFYHIFVFLQNIVIFAAQFGKKTIKLNIYGNEKNIPTIKQKEKKQARIPFQNGDS